MHKLQRTEKLAVADIDGVEVELEERDLPWLQEWDWQFDNQLKQVFRYSNEYRTRKLLYNELMHRVVSRPDQRLPLLSRFELNRLFGDRPEYRSIIFTDRLYKFWGRDAGISFPKTGDILAYTIATSSYACCLWERNDVAFSLINTDGGADLIPTPKIPYSIPFSFIFQFLQHYTGNWKTQLEGKAPEQFADSLLDKALQFWVDSIDLVNGKRIGTKVYKQIQEKFGESNFSLDNYLNNILLITSIFPAP